MKLSDYLDSLREAEKLPTVLNQNSIGSFYSPRDKACIYILQKVREDTEITHYELMRLYEEFYQTNTITGVM